MDALIDDMRNGNINALPLTANKKKKAVSHNKKKVISHTCTNNGNIIGKAFFSRPAPQGAADVCKTCSRWRTYGGTERGDPFEGHTGCSAYRCECIHPSSVPAFEKNKSGPITTARLFRNLKPFQQAALSEGMPEINDDPVEARALVGGLVVFARRGYVRAFDKVLPALDAHFEEKCIKAQTKAPKDSVMVDANQEMAELGDNKRSREQSEESAGGNCRATPRNRPTAGCLGATRPKKMSKTSLPRSLFDARLLEVQRRCISDRLYWETANSEGERLDEERWAEGRWEEKIPSGEVY
jgi:hypothetical protein